jgi:D-alanyl-D-alanine carboxypeptidase/D-alanyl-D-alanine-endopeptidase (penicillin-binding protein 4)
VTGARLLAAALLALGAVAACAEAPLRAPAPWGRGGAAPAAGPSTEGPAPEGPRAPPGLAARTEAAAAAEALAARAALSGRVGWAAIDVATGETLAARAAEEGFAPASVAKIPTALYALEALGPAGRFETRVLADGPIRDGRLAGDLTLSGGGDPELDAADLAALAAETRRTVAAVEGAFRVDAGVAAAAIDDSVPPEAAYNPSVARLNLNFNRVRLAWARAGGRLAHRVEAHAEGWSPPVAAVRVAFAPDDCAGCPTFAHALAPDAEEWRVKRAALAGEGSVWLPVRRPAAYAAEVFRLAAAEAGLALPEATAAAGAAGVVVARRQSRPAIEIVADMLEHSTNLTAEALGLAASAARGLPAADLAGSGRMMAAWSAGFAGADPASFAFANHSGLSPDSRATPLGMARLLAAAARAPAPGVDLAALLEERPLNEEDAPAPEGATVRAKTGTLDFVRGLAGYAATASGRRIAFAIFAGDLERRAATRGGEGRPEGARAWRNRATRLERDLLRLWLARFD